MKKKLLIVLSALTIFSLAACTANPNNSSSNSSTTQVENTDANTVTVNIQNFSFPSSVTIKKGQTVVWKNLDGSSHTVTSSDFDSGAIKQNGTFQHKFDATGEFTYKCTFHPNMTGKIIVQ